MNSTLFERIRWAAVHYPGELDTLTSGELERLERRKGKGGLKNDIADISSYSDCGTGHVRFR